MNTSDVYAKFLRGNGNVKVFPTKKNKKNLTIPKFTLRKVYPFLLASVLSFSACNIRTDSRVKNHSDKIENVSVDDIYMSVIDKYNLDKLKDKEPLTKDMIKSIMEANDVPFLFDVNYNHIPQDNDNFWEIVKNGVKYSVKDVKQSKKLSKKQMKMYEIMSYKMLSQITRIKGTNDEVDLSAHNNLKAFLFFEKVVKYKDDYNNVMYNEDGVYNAFSEIYGRYYEDYFMLFEKTKDYPQISEFAKSLYKSDYKDRMMPGSDSAFYNKESYKILDKWLKKQEIKEDGLVYYVGVEDDVYCNAIANYYRRGRDIEVVLTVDPSGDLGKGYYSPVGEVIVHELMHIMQTKPSSPEDAEDNAIYSENEFVDKDFEQSVGYVDELGPTLMSLAINDYLYKEKNGINQEDVVRYGTFKVKGRDIELGELALWFRKKLDENKENDFGRLSVDKMLASPNVFKELKAISSGYMVRSNFIDLGKER